MAELPSFKKPPVVETVLGVQFDPIRGLTNAHLGALWMTLGAEWASVADAPTLEQQFEKFGDEGTWARHGFQLKLSAEPSARLQIRNRGMDRMIQIQNGRLHLNWLGQSGIEYPRYRELRPEFDSLLGRVCAFLKDAKLEAPKLNQWEVTYVNHVPRGTLWDDPADVANVVRLLGRPTTQPPIGGLESLAGGWHFEIAPKKGRLHVEARHGKTVTPAPTEVLILTLTARGPIDSPEQFYGEGLDIGREAIVSTFAAVTTTQAHDSWERKDA